MSENANDRYERLAAEFQRDTGMMAPGKSVPVEFNDTTDPRERMARWDAWLAARRRTEALVEEVQAETVAAIRSEALADVAVLRALHGEA